MKKKILRVLAVVAGIVFVVCISLSAALSYKVRHIKNTQPALVDRGEFKKPVLQGHKFKYQVCHHFFPIKLFSDSLRDTNTPQDYSCTILYKSKKIVFLSGNQVYSSNAQFFKTGFMKFTYGNKPAKELMRLTYEASKPPDSYFYFTQKHLEDALIYTMGSLGRAMSKAKTFEKYTSGEKIIYIWASPDREHTLDNKIDVLSDDYLVTCIGDDCLEYMSRIDMI